jgi:hypothetical protein
MMTADQIGDKFTLGHEECRIATTISFDHLRHQVRIDERKSAFHQDSRAVKSCEVRRTHSDPLDSDWRCDLDAQQAALART